MKEFVLENEFNSKDIVALFCGEERCAPSHSFGPYVRDSYLIHFCLSGKGVLQDKYGLHEIKSGELFIIRPGEATVYTADKDEPWHYLWIAFIGDIADIFTCDKSVFSYNQALIDRLYSLINQEVKSAIPYSAVILELAHELFSSSKEPKTKIAEIKAYIDYNYMESISVDSLSKLFAFERSYLFRIFKNHFGIGVKEYITKVRMERAKRFLKSGHSVASAAYMTGFSDEFNFSRAFKKHVGISPRDYKKELPK